MVKKTPTKTGIFLPEKLKKKLKKRAEQEGRALSRQIVHMLEQAVQK